MDKEKFLDEIKNNTLGELQLIYETQKDLYSKEEMNIIARRIKELKKEFANLVKSKSLDELRKMYDTPYELYSEEEVDLIENRIQELETGKVQKLLPKEIVCPKCSEPNPFKNDECMYCGYDLDKTKYYDLKYYERKEDDKLNIDEEPESYTFQYVVSFLIPLVGFIIGGILLASESKERVAVGKKCILLGVGSMIIVSIITAIIINSNTNSAVDLYNTIKRK
jgi:hypothetical protein